MEKKKMLRHFCLIDLLCYLGCPPPSPPPKKKITIAYVYVHKYCLRLLMSSLKDQHLVLLL